MKKYGNYRSARESGDWVAAWKAANVLENDLKAIAIADWWKNADLEIVASKLIWSYGHETYPVLDCTDGSEWNCTLGGIPFTTWRNLNLQSLQKKWATNPAKEVLHFWEDWAAIHDPENVDVCRNLIEIVDQGADLQLIEVARLCVSEAQSVCDLIGNRIESEYERAALQAAKFATCSAWFASQVGGKDAWSVKYAGHAAWCATKAVWHIGGEKCEISSVKTWDRYNHMFSLYVLEHLKGKGGR